MKEYQVRIENEANGNQTVRNFTSLKSAQRYFKEYCHARREEGVADDMHVELVEVLEQERIEPAGIEEEYV
jgi:hypothetical protein